jgi:protein-disulfide isomerase
MPMGIVELWYFMEKRYLGMPQAELSPTLCYLTGLVGGVFAKNYMKKNLAWLISVLVLVFGELAFAAPMTQSQGDEIIKELRDIKQLLARPQQPILAAPMEQGKSENLTIKGGGTYVLGKSDAPLTLVEFTDYECPFCKRFYETTFQVLKTNYIDTGKLKFISRNMPLPMHTHALKAALAANCAGEQGKFWEMKDKLFRNQGQLEVEALAKYAAEITLNADLFKICMSDERRQKAISDEGSYINSLGVNGTPTFVIGKTNSDSVEGHKIVGAQPIEVFEAAINEIMGAH